MPYYRKIFYLFLFVILIFVLYDQFSYHKADFYCYPPDNVFEIRVIKNKKIKNQVKCIVTIANIGEKAELFVESQLKCGLDNSRSEARLNLPIPLTLPDTLWPGDTLHRNIYFTFSEDEDIDLDSLFFFYRHPKEKVTYPE